MTLISNYLIYVLCSMINVHTNIMKKNKKEHFLFISLLIIINNFSP